MFGNERTCPAGLTEPSFADRWRANSGPRVHNAKNERNPAGNKVRV
jgi:hypothetical protein